MLPQKLAKRLLILALGSNFHVRLRLSRIRSSGRRIILNLHRVEHASPHDGESLSPLLFDQLLCFLKEEFTVTTFLAEEGQRRADTKPVVILSFDDGYKDFAEVAAPILRRHGIRCNQNIIPSCVESQLPPLNVLARDFVSQAPQTFVDRLVVPGLSLAGGKHMGAQLSKYLKNRPYAEQTKISELLLPQFFAWEGFRPRPMMSRADVKQLLTEHEIGAHSYAHASMAYESLDFLLEDVRKCREYFDHVLGSPLYVYAFPNGSCTADQVALLEREGIRHVLLVGEDFDTHPTQHARFTFYANNLREARWRATGGLRAVRR